MKKKEIGVFVVFLFVFLFILYYHYKNKVIQSVDISLPVSDKIIEDISGDIVDAPKPDIPVIIPEDDPVIETLIIKKSDIIFSDWNISLKENTTAEFFVSISQEGEIETIELVKSSGLYSIDKILYDEITGLDVVKTEVKTLLNVKYIISYEK